MAGFGPTGEPGGRNPILDLLGEIGLPLRESRRDLIARHGIRRHPAYRWDVIEIETARPLTAGLLWPLWATVRDTFALDLPVVRFDGAAAFGPHASANIEGAARPLADHLGAAPIRIRHGALRCEWQCGASSVVLTAWPPELRRSAPDHSAHERDPRLIAACHVAVATGYRPPLSIEERGWLADFVPLLAVGRGDSTAGDILRRPATEDLLELVREPCMPLEGLLGRAGRSRGGEALIICSDQLYVVGAERLLGFRVDRRLPARGAGGSRLEALCASADGGTTSKRLTVAVAGGPYDLDEAGPALAAAFGRLCELGRPDPDL